MVDWKAAHPTIIGHGIDGALQAFSMALEDRGYSMFRVQFTPNYWVIKTRLWDHKFKCFNTREYREQGKLTDVLDELLRNKL